LSQTLTDLEQQRSAISSQIQELGDFRSGSITAITGQYGKAGCRCHQSGQPGHGPNYRLTRKVNGKTVSGSFATPAALRKAEHGIAAFHRFRERKNLPCNARSRIRCRARKKTAETILHEAEREIGTLLEVVFGGLRKTGRFDLKAVEMATRAPAHQLGAKIIEQLLSAPAKFAREIGCPCGQHPWFHQMSTRDNWLQPLARSTSSASITFAQIVTKGKARAMSN
jgi:hypothetical protein